MGEFEAFNSLTGQWEILAPSKFNQVRNDPKYTAIRVDERDL